MDVFRQIPLLGGAVESYGLVKSKFQDFHIKMKIADKSVTSSIRKIKKFKKLALDHHDDDDEIEFERTEQALMMAEVSLSRAAQELSTAEKAFFALSKDFHDQREAFGDVAIGKNEQQSDYLAGVNGALSLAIDSAKNVSGTVHHLV
jgi:hypothetical protein